MSRPLRHCFAALCAVSLALSLGMIGLGAVAGRIPWDVPDSRGRIFSFNGPMSAEHFANGLSKVTESDFLREAGTYGAALVIAHLIGIALLTCPSNRLAGWQRAFFALQPALFPFGLAAMFFVPWLLIEPFDSLDAEFFTDGIPAWLWATGLWVPLSGIIAVCARTEAAVPEAPAEAG